MKFSHVCYIHKNTPELIQKLKELGYLNGGVEKGEILITAPTFTDDIYTTFPEWESKETDEDHIDCGTNDNLFIAIAALRDDSDIHQWFVNNRDEWILSNRDNFFSQQHLNTEDEFNEIKALDYFILTESHKATVKELIEHFK